MHAQLDRIAARVDRLTLDRRDPERFFVDRSEIAHDLRRLARGAGYSPEAERQAAPLSSQSAEIGEGRR